MTASATDFAVRVERGRQAFDDAGYVDGQFNPWAPSNREGFAGAFALIDRAFDRAVPKVARRADVRVAA